MNVIFLTSGNEGSWSRDDYHLLFECEIEFCRIINNWFTITRVREYSFYYSELRKVFCLMEKDMYQTFFLAYQLHLKATCALLRSVSTLEVYFYVLRWALACKSKKRRETWETNYPRKVMLWVRRRTSILVARKHDEKQRSSPSSICTLANNLGKINYYLVTQFTIRTWYWFENEFECMKVSWRCFQRSAKLQYSWEIKISLKLTLNRIHSLTLQNPSCTNTVIPKNQITNNNSDWCPCMLSA